jgi:hypothetical protein
MDTLHETLPFLPPTVPSVATSLPFLAAILPLLPPITRNVKLADRATRLECGSRDRSEVETQVKKRQKRQC